MFQERYPTTIKRGLRFMVDEQGRPSGARPWAGELVALIYDWAMSRSVFPRLFAADQDKHGTILGDALSAVHGQGIVELGTGSGSAADWLPNDNRYVGNDISPALLRQARKRFAAAGFENATFYVAPAADLPFSDGQVDLILCVLTLNFCGSTEVVLAEVARLLVFGGRLLCCVPVPERAPAGSTIHGELHPSDELAAICRRQGLSFQPLDETNGALLYFWATRQ